MSAKQRREYGSGSVSQRKDGTWTARMVIGFTEKGTPKIKAFYGKTEREVKRKLKEFQIEYYKNDQVVVKKRTVEDFMWNWFINTKSNTLKPKSFDRLEQTLKYQVFPRIGGLQVAALRPSDIQAMINDLKAAGYSQSSIKKAYDAVNECFRTGVIQKSVVSNPALGVTLPLKSSYKKSKISFYTEEEAARLTEAALAKHPSGKPVYRLGDAIVLALNTGLRMAELISLKWSDISFEDESLTVSTTRVTVKNRGADSDRKYIVLEQDSAKSETSSRTIYLNREAMDALRRLEQINGDLVYVLATKNGTPISGRNLDRLLRNIAAYAGFPEDRIFGIHSLRHTFATMLLSKGVDVKVVSEILGHASITITYDTYIHVMKDQKKSAVNRISSFTD